MILRWSDVSQLKRNILLNIAGKVWASLLLFLFVPVQVRILGMEAYGLLGFMASLQMLFSLLDLGLSATITREIAMDRSEDGRDAGGLIRSFGFIYWLVGGVIGAGLFLGANWICREWLHFETLPEGMAVDSVRIIGIATAMRWPIALYSGIITGLQRRDVVNILDAAAGTFRSVGGVIVLLVWRTLPAFMLWNLVAAVAEIAAYIIAASKLYRGGALSPSPSLGGLKRVWRFAVGMNVLVLFSILFTQSDRQIMAKTLSMEALGVYSLAYNAAAGILAGLPSLVTSAMFPTLAADFGAQALDQFRTRHVRGSQVIVALVALPAFGLMFFGHDLLSLWISDVMADRAWDILALLALGFMLNAMAGMSAVSALAAGRPGISIWTNVAVIWVYLPALYLATRKWGGLGAAGVWVGLNAYYLVSLLPLVHAKIVKKSALAWAIRDVGPIVAIAALLVTAAKAIAAASFGRDPVFLGILGAAVVVLYCLFTLRFLGSRIGSAKKLVPQERPVPHLNDQP